MHAWGSLNRARAVDTHDNTIAYIHRVLNNGQSDGNNRTGNSDETAHANGKLPHQVPIVKNQRIMWTNDCYFFSRLNKRWYNVMLLQTQSHSKTSAASSRSTAFAWMFLRWINSGRGVKDRSQRCLVLSQCARVFKFLVELITFCMNVYGLSYIGIASAGWPVSMVALTITIIIIGNKTIHSSARVSRGLLAYC